MVSDGGGWVPGGGGGGGKEQGVQLLAAVCFPPGGVGIPDAAVPQGEGSVDPYQLPRESP